MAAAVSMRLFQLMKSPGKRQLLLRTLRSRVWTSLPVMTLLSCLIGPNGAGKSTILHAIFGFNNIFSGKITIGSGEEQMDVTALSPNEKLSRAGIAYILQDKSIFPGMTVEENLWMGGFLKDQPAEAKRAAEMVFDKYSRLAARRKHQAGVLSGGERRLLEISRALVMNPEVLLVDEPSEGIGVCRYRLCFSER